MNPEHLLDQAERLLLPPPRGAPRQADKRRAVSSAHYAVFHGVAHSVAGSLVGAGNKQEARYRALYRSVAHARIRSLSQDVLKSAPPNSWRPYWPPGGFGPDIKAFATLYLDLIRARHVADYDPSFKLNTADAKSAIAQGRTALRRLGAAPAGERDLFVTLLVSSPQG